MPNDLADLQLMTIKQAAELLAVCPRTIRRLIDKKTLIAVRIAGAVRVRKRDVELLIEGPP